ncbi:MAG: ImmA/IrrE family metallo-endopeptidase [Acidobacteriota bacterium]|nr:ImmA/IrrE family metallo-endopeptidase [Acidobacteriota bacterium]
MAPLELPPGEKWRQYELQALGLRDFARVPSDAALNPFALARFANLLVVDFDKLRDLSQQTREQLLGSAAEEWSGGATSRALPDGRKVVILNPTHGRARTNATLMEEICHVFLNHQANRLAIIANDEHGKTLARDYRKADEEEAYATGAAALVPYGALRRLILKGREATEIARHFRVSKDLVEYRVKVTRLWKTYKSARSNRAGAKEFQA